MGAVIHEDVKIVETSQEVIAFLEGPLDAKALQLDGGVVVFSTVFNKHDPHWRMRIGWKSTSNLVCTKV